MIFLQISQANLHSSEASTQPSTSSDLIHMPPETLPSIILLILALGIVWHKKRQAQRQSLVHQRAMLERIWEMSHRK